jgi:hypothetical protein
MHWLVLMYMYVAWIPQRQCLLNFITLVFLSVNTNNNYTGIFPNVGQMIHAMVFLWSYSERSEYVLFVVTFRKIRVCVICGPIQKDQSMYYLWSHSERSEWSQIIHTLIFLNMNTNCTYYSDISNCENAMI